MSVTFDGPNKLINVNVGVTSLDVRVDLYSAWKEWMVIGDNSKYLPAMSAIGGDPITATTSLGVTYFLENGWRIKPWSGEYSLEVVGNLYTREPGQSPFVSPDNPSTIAITLARSNIVDQVNISGGAAADPSDVADAVWSKLLSAPLVPGSIGEHVAKKLTTKLDLLTS